jgi:hypothetical protein
MGDEGGKAMATTEERLREPTQERVREPAEELAGRGGPAARELERLLERSPGARVARWWSGGLLVAWLAGFGALVAFEPTPDEATVEAWAAAVGTLFLLAMGATLTGLATNRPWALKASTATAGAGMVMAAACAQTGHHAGGWWIAELAVFTGLLALTLTARRAPVVP